MSFSRPLRRRLRLLGWRAGLVAWLAAFLCVGAALAEEATPRPYDAEHDARERARIHEERARAVAKYNAELEDCYQRFAVNACLRDARRARRVVIDELRRQELVLNDAKRVAEAQAQKERVEQRQLEREQQEAERERERTRSRPRGNTPATPNR